MTESEKKQDSGTSAERPDGEGASAGEEAFHVKGEHGRGREVKALIMLAGLAAVYCSVVGSMLSRAYIDVGDGNYLYTSSRMADGLMIYRDFLSPQPPMHLLTGSLLVRLGRWSGADDGALYAVRIFSIVLHVLTMGWIYLLGRRFLRDPYGGVVAAFLYLVIPTGFWWSLGYQSELQEIFWMMGSLWCFIRFRPLAMVCAGAMAALSVLTNMTAAPYAAASMIYLVMRLGLVGGRDFSRGGVIRGGWWGLVFCYLVPFAAVLGGVAAYYEMRTDAFFLNVILNQVGSYPKDGLWDYALRKVIEQGGKIFYHEGGFIILGLLGLVMYNREDDRPEREYVVWYSLALLLSLLYVSKGGTMDYIFTIGEPVLALFGAYFLAKFYCPCLLKRFLGGSLLRDTSLFPQLAFLVLILVVVAFFPARFLTAVYRQEQFEQSEGDVDRQTFTGHDGTVYYLNGLDRVVSHIQNYSEPGDVIMAPPYYAFLTGRLLAEEYSELFLWTLKYQLEAREVLAAAEDLTNPAALLEKMAAGRDPAARFVWERFTPDGRNFLARARLDGSDAMSDEEVRLLVNELNRLILQGLEPGIFRPRQRLEVKRFEPFYEASAFAGIELPAFAKKLLEEKPAGADFYRLNRVVLDLVFTGEIRRSEAAWRVDGAGEIVDGEGVVKVKSMAEMLRRRQVPVVAANVDLSNLQLLASPEVRLAIQRYYKPLVSEEELSYYKSLNFLIQIYVPKTYGEME